MAHQLYQSLACGMGGSICPPTKDQRLQTIARELKALPPGPNSLPRAKALRQEAVQLMRNATPQEQKSLEPAFRKLRGIFSDILSGVVGTVADTIQGALGGGDDVGEDCYYENGEEWCYY